MIIEFSRYLERRRQTADARVLQVATVSPLDGRAARQGTARLQRRLGSAAVARWKSFLPVLPALELAVLYAEASLI